MRQILPATAGGAQIGMPGPDQAGQAAAEAIARLYAYPPDPARPWVRANMVASTDGAATLDGRSGGLSGPADEAIFSVLRSLADVILVGAGTARAERYQPVRASETWPALRAGRPQTPPIAVVTSRMSGMSPDDPLFSAGPGEARTLVLTTEQSPAKQRAALAAKADVIIAGPAPATPAALIGALAQRGYRRILTEGGPSLLAQIVAAGLLDELCLTVSPVLAGGQAGRILSMQAMAADGAAGGGPSAEQEPASLRVAHVLEDHGQLLCRYLRTAA